MAFVMTFNDGENPNRISGGDTGWVSLATGPEERSGPRGVNLERLAFALALLVGAVLCIVSINDFRTSLTMLVSAVNCLPCRFDGHP